MRPKKTREMPNLRIPEIMPTPAHVPEHLVHNLDMFEPPGLESDVHGAWKRIQDDFPDFFWTPRNGGHWIATRADDIKTVQEDYTRFSNTRSLIPDIGRPYPAAPLDTDLPTHGLYRLMISPALAPKAVAALEDTVRKTAIGVVEGLKPKGECEFVQDFAKVLPVAVFLGMVDLPSSETHRLLPVVESIARAKDPEEITAARRYLADYVRELIAQRTKAPGDDLISHIIHYEINNKQLTDDQKLGACSNLLARGLDTVTSMISFAAHFLAMHPGHRRRIVEDPDIIPNAADELIRRHGVVNAARLITHDFEFKGAALKKGELIQIPNALYGLDEQTNHDPMTVDFDRQLIDHAEFGNGPHECPGANLARLELRCFLEEWMPRIPKFEVKAGTQPRFKSGIVNSINQLRLSWAA
jgi:cytochrome P450